MRCLIEQSLVMWPLEFVQNKFHPIRPEAGKLFNTFDSSKLEVLGVVYEQAFSWSWIYSDAVVNGHHEVAEHLKARGGSVSEFQLAHLMNSAACTGDIKTLKRLIRWTGQVNVSDFDGQTPLHTAAMNGRLNVTNLLLKEGAGKYNVRSRGKQLTIIGRGGAKYRDLSVSTG